MARKIQFSACPAVLAWVLSTALFSATLGGCTKAKLVDEAPEQVAITSEPGPAPSVEPVRLGKPVAGFALGNSGGERVSGVDSVSGTQVAVHATFHEPVKNNAGRQEGQDSVTSQTVRVVSGIHGVINSYEN